MTPIFAVWRVDRHAAYRELRETHRLHCVESPSACTPSVPTSWQINPSETSDDRDTVFSNKLAASSVAKRLHMATGISLLGWAGLATAGPSAEQLAADFAVARPVIIEHGVYRLNFTEREFAKAAKPGGVARRRERLDGADRVVGMMWTEVPRDKLWLAIQDDDNWDGVVSGLSQEILLGSTPQHKVLYQHVVLPWPFSPRQWLIDIVNNQPISAASRNQVWERTWTPSTRRDATIIDPDAVWVEVNDGGWLLIQASGGTLMCYHARTVVGGNVPNNLATQYAYFTLTKMMREIVERAGKINGHYSEGHELLYRPDGSVIPVF